MNNCRASASNNAAQLSYYMGQMVKTAATAISDTNTQLFNGSANSVADLYRTIDNGNLMESTDVSSDLDAQAAVENAVYSVLIPYAWSLSNLNSHPVVIDTGYDCSDLWPSYFHDYIAEDTAKDMSVCYKGSLYYLLDARNCNTDCSGPYPPGSTVCTPTKFFKPIGVEKLDGDAWGGITIQNLAISYVLPSGKQSST